MRIFPNYERTVIISLLPNHSTTFNKKVHCKPAMALKSLIYDYLPEPAKPMAERWYNIMVYRTTNESLHSNFVEYFFDSRGTYEGFVDEFENGPVADLRSNALRKYQKLTGKDTLSDIGLAIARDYYAVTREIEPRTVIETGVCNGISSLSILLALEKNGAGMLHSIDYPFRADEPLEDFREETFEDYGGAAIPSDKEPGWIIPEDLKRRWKLTIGKSQRELPKLITELENLDLFIHDSEHSYPCMMFEYELAYEWLEEEGVLLSDDITWNQAYPIFTKVRKPEHGRLSYDVGYMRK